MKVIAEGEENELERFIRAIDIKNAVIHVSAIASNYSPATGDFEGFYKQVSPGETNSRLDSAVVHLKDLKDAVNNMNSNLGGKMDQMIGKQDRMLSGQDELLVEVKDLNRNMSDKMDLMKRNNLKILVPCYFPLVKYKKRRLEIINVEWVDKIYIEMLLILDQ